MKPVAAARVTEIATNVEDDGGDVELVDLTEVEAAAVKTTEMATAAIVEGAQEDETGVAVAEAETRGTATPSSGHCR